MKRLLWLLFLLAPNLMGQGLPPNPTSGGPIPSSTYTTPSYIGNSGSGAIQGNVITVATSCPASALNVSCFQVFADVIQTPEVASVWDVVTTSGGSNVSSASSTWTAADVGKFIQATTNCLNPPSTVVIAKTLITGFTDANHISIAPATAASTGTTACAKYGHVDTTALKAAWAVCLASSTNRPCILNLPAGDMFFDKALFVDNAHPNRQQTYAIAGQGAATVLTPTTDFDTTTCATGAGGFGNGSFGIDSWAIWESNATGGAVGAGIPNIDTLKDFTIDGMGIPGNTAGGNGFCGVIAGLRVEMYNVHIWNWMYGAASNSIGLKLVGPSEVHGVLVNDVGQTTCLSNGSNNNAVTVEQIYCTGATAFCLQVTGTMYSYGSFYGPCGQQTVVVHSGNFSSYGDIIQPHGTFGLKVGDVSAAQFNCYGSVLGLNTDVGAPSIYVYSTSVFNIGTGCVLQHSVGSGQLFGGVAGGVVYDGAGGPLIGTPQGDGVATINMMGDGSITGIPQVIGNIVLSGNWGTSPSVALSGPTVQDTKIEQFTITVGSGAPGANPVVTVTFPQKFWTTQVPICKLDQIGGTQTALALPFTSGTPTNASVAFTYNGTPTVSATIIARMLCSVSE